MQADSVQPYLSIVAASRNDDHGGDPLRRTQLFIDSLKWQAERYRLSIELILVDWNPPASKPLLADVLCFPKSDYFSARTIVVPPEIHTGFRHAEALSFFQMIAKNIGIRRAKGEFIVATNIDVLLDDSLFAYIAKKELSKDFMYRADRYDVMNSIPAEHEAQQVFCRNPDNQIRRNHRLHPSNYSTEQEKSSFDSSALLASKGQFPYFELTKDEAIASADIPVHYLNTNGCGDFTLLHRDAWASLHGYGEFEAFSMHIDSIGCIAAHLAGFREIALLPPMVCYHIEHAPASGWTPEGESALYERIRKKKIPLFDYGFLERFLFEALLNSPDKRLNDDSWGLRDFCLEEHCFLSDGRRHVTPVSPVHYYRPLSAILPSYHYTLFTEECMLRLDDTVFLLRRIAFSRWRKIGLFFGLTTKFPYDENNS